MTPDDETITPELTPVGFSDALVKLWAEDVERAGHVVLFVDDCSDTLHMLEVMFRDDYVVHLADSAEAAVRLLSTGIEPHAIVSDQMMPGMRGVQFLKLMSETNPLSARVLFSAHDDMRAVRDAIKYCADPSLCRQASGREVPGGDRGGGSHRVAAAASSLAGVPWLRNQKCDDGSWSTLS